MTTATYDQLTCPDPTETYAFKAGLFVDRLLARLRVRLLVEVARLLFLGFYDDLQNFLRTIQLAEERAQSEAEYKAIWNHKAKVALKTAELVSQLESIGNVRYGSRGLVDYVVGADRLDQLKLFVEISQFEQAGEAILAQAKRDFLTAYGKRAPSKTQRTALLEKHKELRDFLSGLSSSAS